MGLVTGSASYVRYVVVGELPDDWEDVYPEVMSEHGFREIDPNGDREVSVGWVRRDDAFEAAWGPGELFRPGGAMIWRLRIDTLKVPATTLKAHVTRAEQLQMAKLEREKLTRPERTQIKTDIGRQLRRASLPRMQLVDIAWDLSSGEVRLFGTGKSVRAYFVDLFEKTFGVRLLALDPTTLLLARGASDEEIDAIAALEPTPFQLAMRGPAAADAQGVS
jgi:recombination associated protein RdgC